MARALWLPDVLRAAGLKVQREPGWETRGKEAGTFEGVVLHHTAGPATGNAPSLRIVRDGRSDLPGPLSCAVLARDGTWIIVSCGRANHAGVGTWNGLSDGNGRFLGVEAEATGTAAWPDVQMDSYRRGVAAILRRLGKDASWACGHKEYATPKGRKPDPNFDMHAFRASVTKLLATNTPAPAPSPTPEEDPLFTPQPGAVHIVSALTDMVLDLPDTGSESDPLLMYPCDGGKDQRMCVVEQGSNEYDILCSFRRWALDAWYKTGEKALVGNQVRVFTPHGGSQQRWLIETLPGANIRIIHKESGLVLKAVPGSPGRIILAEPAPDDLSQVFRYVRTV